MTIKKTIRALMVLLVAILCLCLYFVNQNKVSALGEIEYSADELVNVYMDAIQSENSRLISAIVPSGMMGIYEKENSQYISIEQAEKEGLFLKKNKESLEKIKQILTYQHNEIINMWGENAFKNFSYELIEMEPDAAFSKEIYVVKNTGQKVSFEEYIKINQEYWAEIGKKNDIDPSLIFTTEYTGLYLENIENEPVKIALESDMTEYLVKLYFNGKDTTDEEISFFRFYIKGNEDSWKIKLGMQWDYPLGDTEGDI